MLSNPTIHATRDPATPGLHPVFNAAHPHDPVHARFASACVLILMSALAFGQDQPSPDPAPPPMLASSAALRATVFGTPPDQMAEQPERVPLSEIDIRMPWARPLPDVFWFNRRLRVWFSAQPAAAPLAIVISGTGADGNTTNIQRLRGALYGAGYHVLSLPSPTFPGFIAAASSTGVPGDLRQDGNDLHASIGHILANLPEHAPITAIDVLGYSLGGANAAMVKAIDAREGQLGIRRAVMINPPVNLFTSIGRLDRLFEQSIGPADPGLERLYQRLYAELANLYRASDAVQIDENFLLAAAATALSTDEEFAAAIALTFRLALVDMFFAGDLYAGTGVVVDPRDPPRKGESLDAISLQLRAKPFAEYFDKVFAPYYLARIPGSTRESLVTGNSLAVIGDALRGNDDYFVQTNRDDLILDASELEWLERTMGPRIVVYDHGGHLGTIGERRQIADLLAMLDGRWNGGVR